ncbi:MAG: VPLPA-CTERM sorting domain-containing protein [Pseudomonadales bacterium]|nr:VPLPA-CTERM sorting domain-containing protein [Pseudomonadales bacterium]
MFTFLSASAASGNDIRGCGLDVNNCTLFNADRVNFPPINVNSIYIDTFAVIYYSPDCGPGCEGWANQGAQGITLNYDTANSGNVTLVTFTPSPVPIPAAAWLFGSALLGLAAVKRKTV